MGEITGNGQAQGGLGGAAGFGETALARSDDASFRIDVSAVFENGFTIGNAHFAADALFVATDGFISFGSAPSAGYFDDPTGLTTPFFAAFMADIDTRLDGEGAESGPIWVDVDAVNDVVTITWHEVGFYRRNADLTNTFQIQLFDRGALGMDVVFRYDTISWTSGDLQGGWHGLDGSAAIIGQRGADSGRMFHLPTSGDGAGQLNLPQTIGNTGVAGLWVFHVPADGTLNDPPLAETGGNGADELAGQNGDDTLMGFAGNDTLHGGEGADVLDGGLGFDLASYGAAQLGVIASLADPSRNTGAALGDSYLSIEGLIGSAGNDLLEGNAQANRLEGGAGDDTLLGGSGADTLLGGAGFDWASYASSAGVVVDLGNTTANTGDAQGDVYISIEAVLGSNGADTLRGDGSHNLLLGGAGQDFLDGAAGDDQLFGGDGDDAVLGNLGHDTLYGGSGTDWLLGSAGNDQIFGDHGGDALYGGQENDSLWGGDGGDLLYGGAGDDYLHAGPGTDRLYGELGHDTLVAGTGQDHLQGGSGRDHFVFRSIDDLTNQASSTDIISGFRRGVDKIDLSQINADLSHAGQDSLRIMPAPPSAATGSSTLYFRQIDNYGRRNDYTLIYLDLDGDGQSEAMIKIMGLHGLTAGDFMF